MSTTTTTPTVALELAETVGLARVSWPRSHLLRPLRVLGELSMENSKSCCATRRPGSREPAAELELLKRADDEGGRSK